MARRGRKVTPLLVADSFAGLEILRLTVTVLRRWYPSSMALAIIEQQLPMLDAEFKALDVALPAEAPGEMFEEQG